MYEAQIQQALVARLNAAKGNPAFLTGFKIDQGTGDANTLYDLIGDRPFETLVDTSDFNLNPEFMIDIMGKNTIDIVLRSPVPRRNRIYIEVKRDQQPLRRGKYDSQIIRYFLHLLCITVEKPDGKPDIHRAMLLAAPSDWFQKRINQDTWEYFLDKYTDIARHFDITLGKLEIDDLIKTLS